MLTLLFAWQLNQNQLMASEKTEMEGFMRAGASYSNSETEYMDRIDSEGSYEDNHFGVLIKKEIDHRWSATGEVFGAGYEEDYTLKIEKAYVTFRAYQEGSFDIGKIAYPNLIVSGYATEGVNYPWLRPPEEVYRTNVLGPSLNYSSFSGVKANYVKGIKKFEFVFSAYAGGATVEHDKMSNMSGAMMRVGDDRFKAHIGYNRSTLNLGTDTHREVVLDNRKQFVKSAGINFDLKYVFGMGEYLVAEVEGVDEVSTTAFYYTYGLRFGKFMMHYTVAEFEAENHHGQESVAYGIKYQASNFASFKMEYKLIKPSERVDTDPLENPSGHFSEVPAEEEIALFGVALDVKF